MVAASSALPAAPMWRMIALIFNKFHKHRINITHVAGTEGRGRAEGGKQGVSYEMQVYRA